MAWLRHKVSGQVFEADDAWLPIYLANRDIEEVDDVVRPEQSPSEGHDEPELGAMGSPDGKRRRKRDMD